MDIYDVETEDHKTCNSAPQCLQRHAVFFVHGIYGSTESFVSEEINWPEVLKSNGINGQEVDVYIINYDSQMFSWFADEVTTLDGVVEKLYEKMYGQTADELGLLERRPYKSYGFIAHSLGGNVTASFIHSVKSGRGHIERAKSAYIVTLGTPAQGSELANFAGLAKSVIPGMTTDPLLSSLEWDNTFLRMLRTWRIRASNKAKILECRKVPIYTAYETEPTSGFEVVAGPATISFMDSQNFGANYSLVTESKIAEGYNHNDLAKPTFAKQEVYEWVTKKQSEALSKADSWKGALCRGICYSKNGTCLSSKPNEWPFD